MEIEARNTNDLQSKVYAALQEHGIYDTSRNGEVLRFNEPVTTILTHPLEKVNFCPVRDANPFFHLVEAIAMIAGYNSVKLMSFFASNMASFSDDGVTYNAFYGTRMRMSWGDQLDKVIETLRDTPDSRQAVINLWNPNDLWTHTVDKACNLQIIFSIVEGKLRMTTTNRSNDAIWGGVNGANVVHFAFFMEYVCCALDIEPEKWFHFSNNLHVYTDNPKWQKLKDLGEGDMVNFNYTPYNIPLFTEPNQITFDIECMQFCKALECILEGVIDPSRLIGGEGLFEFKTPFLNKVVRPMVAAFLMWKSPNYSGSEVESYMVQVMRTEDPWLTAGYTWMKRRNFERKGK